jgi:hypothetical protein
VSGKRLLISLVESKKEKVAEWWESNELKECQDVAPDIFEPGIALTSCFERFVVLQVKINLLMSNSNI